MKGHTFLTGLGIGAIAMYLMDPNQGRRRRALLREKFNRRDSTGNKPGLEGSPAGSRAGEHAERTHAHWSPSARLVAGGVGTAMALYALAQAGLIGAAAGVAGVGLVLRGALNLELSRLFGVGADHQAVVMEKAVEVTAPSPESAATTVRFQTVRREEIA